MEVGDLIEYVDDNEKRVSYAGFIGCVGVVEKSTTYSVRVRWLKSDSDGPWWSDFEKSRFKIISKVRKDK